MFFEDEVSSLSAKVSDACAFLHEDDLQKKHDELTKIMSEPNFWDDVEHAQAISVEDSGVVDTLDKLSSAKNELSNLKCAVELLEDASDKSEKEMLEKDCAQIKNKLESLLDEIEIETFFDGEFDGCDAVLTINPGQGGLEAQDWTEMLFNMYLKYASLKKWKVKVLDTQVGEAIGLDRASIQISGKFAYGMMKAEAGVHRLVRISPTDAKKRRHTTFASVDVIPLLPDKVEVDLDEADIRVDVYRSSGPGGQCVNTTDSAVRLTHIPTGIVVSCQNEKSQIMNKASAMRVLKSRLYDLEVKKRNAELAQIRGEKMDNSFGSQIRNYVLYPFQLVKDTRDGLETSNTTAVLNGDIDNFILGYHKYVKKNSKID